MIFDDPQLFPIMESLLSSENYTSSYFESDNVTCEMNSPPRKKEKETSMLKYTCQRHPQKPLDLVCTAEECNLKGLICNMCAFEGHQEHIRQCIPLEIFVMQISVEKTKLNEEQLKLKRKCYELRSQEEELLREYQARINCFFYQKFARLNAERMEYLQKTERIINPTQILLDILSEDTLSQSQCSGALQNILKRIKLQYSKKQEFIKFNEYEENILFLEKTKQQLSDQLEYTKNQIGEACGVFISKLSNQKQQEAMNQLKQISTQKKCIKQNQLELHSTNKKEYPIANLYSCFEEKDKDHQY